jgi:hypothetical protein
MKPVKVARTFLNPKKSLHQLNDTGFKFLISKMISAIRIRGC